MTDSPDGGTSGYAAFRYRDFTLFLGARFFSGMAVQMQITAIFWQLWKLTDRELILGLVGVALFLPALLLIFVIGTVADRFDRRRILIAAYGVELICGGAFIALAGIGPQEYWSLFIVLALLGAARGFAMPTGQAILPNIVPPAVFPNAVAWNSTVSEIASIIGPAIGGLLLVVGFSMSYGVSVVLLVIATGLTVAMRVRRTSTEREQIGWQSLLAGFRFIFRRSVILGAISMDLFAVLLGGVIALMPVYADDILDSGPIGLGMLRAAPAVGALIVAFGLTRWPVRRHVGRHMFIAVAIFGVALLTFGLSTAIWLSVAALVVAGGADMISMFIRASLVQLHTPDALRGRVSTVNSVFIGASNEMGDARAGFMGEYIGPVAAVVFGAVGTLAVTGLWAQLFPSLRKVDRFTDEQAGP
ncbi:MAG: MFS transporter [Alphaproteobacteria bacterium]